MPKYYDAHKAKEIFADFYSSGPPIGIAGL